MKQGKEGKFERDERIANEILSKGVDNLSKIDRLTLLSIYNVSYHDSGKIEGISSCDSSCHGCTFCQRMRKAAEKDPTIICGKCYDYKLELLRSAMMKRHMLNLKIMSTVPFEIDELATLPLTNIARIDSSGDIENDIHAENMIKLIIAHPYSHVGFWTKNTPCVDRAIDKFGKPSNMVYIESDLHINGSGKHSRYADYTFTVYTADMIETVLANGACECNGKKCKECGFKCYLHAWENGANIAERLRP